jgi:hypothetical protein
MSCPLSGSRFTVCHHDEYGFLCLTLFHVLIAILCIPIFFATPFEDDSVPIISFVGNSLPTDSVQLPLSVSCERYLGSYLAPCSASSVVSVVSCFPHPLLTHHFRPLVLFTILMLLTVGITYFSLFLSVFAVPLKRAACSNGRSASSETCCVWFDVLDDIQQNLCVL